MTMRQILLGLGFLGVLFTALVGGTGWWGLHAIGHSMDSTVVSTAATQNATMGDMMHEGLRGDVFQALMYAQTGQAQGLRDAQKDAQEHGATFLHRIQALQALPTTSSVKAQVNALAPLVDRYTQVGAEVTQLAGKDSQAALARLPDFIAQFDQLEVEQAKLIQAIEEESKATDALADETRARTLWVLLGTTLLGAALMLAAALAVTRHLMQTLGGEPTTVRRLLHKVAAGDLGFQVRLRPGDADSLMAGLHHMVKQLSHTVSQVRDHANSVASASSQVAGGSADLSERTQDQAAALERSASALEQLSSTVGHNAENAASANHLAQGASKVANQGGQVVEKLVATMQDIHRSSQKIADIIGVIDGIAFQTNILALNAAVEAARAGEQGRGFAVVASEVRSLAKRSAEAAHEIKSLITSSVERVTIGAEQADQAGSTMQEIVSAIARVTHIIGEISNASHEQTSGIDQVSQAVNQMDQGTQSNAALVEQTAAAAEGLRDRADHLTQTVAVFKLRAAAPA